MLPRLSLRSLSLSPLKRQPLARLDVFQASLPSKPDHNARHVHHRDLRALPFLHLQDLQHKLARLRRDHRIRLALPRRAQHSQIAAFVRQHAQQRLFIDRFRRQAGTHHVITARHALYDLSLQIRVRDVRPHVDRVARSHFHHIQQKRSEHAAVRGVLRLELSLHTLTVSIRRRVQRSKNDNSLFES